ncbi:MAG: SpoIIE family protein phosphatase [Terracidiphilus sp.]|jgi:serine phosphatase RsbU (regulator of sigma subunit)
MNKLPLALALSVVCACGMVCAQTPASSANSAIPMILNNAQSLEWMTDIDKGWRVHEGDNPAYAQPGFDDASWRFVALDDLGPAQTGWRWFRLHVRLPANHPQLALLIEGAEGTYALYINGVAMPGPEILSSVGVSVPIERAVRLNLSGDDLVIALRIRVPPSYASQRLPVLRFASLGTPMAVETARQALQSVRLYAAFPSIAINLLLMLAGIGAIVLYRSQPRHSEYKWLGLYLLLSGLSSALWGCQLNGLLPLSANYLVGDPMVYLFTIAQLEFTYSFGGRRVGRAWRVYEALLFTPILLIWFTWQGQLPFSTYIVVEALIVVPVALLLPIFLFVWYRRGNREAGWLILPSLALTALVTINDLGDASILLGWHLLDFFHHWIPIGAARFQPNDIAELLFLLAIAVVMFFRFTRVSREQARHAAELDAARQIQQRLVPATYPSIEGWRIEVAYIPAQEVGGDFYQVIEGDGNTLLVVGDVGGKGLKAAMLVALLVGSIRSRAELNTDPQFMLKALNRCLLGHGDAQATCLALSIAKDGAITLANSGHLPPHLNGEPIEMQGALPLGMIDVAEPSLTHFQLMPGDKLTLMSDGIAEATDSNGQLFGFERVHELLRVTTSPAGIAAAAQSFGQQDDITVLTVERTPALESIST